MAVHKPLGYSVLNQKEAVGILPIKIKTNTFSYTQSRRPEGQLFILILIYKKIMPSNRLPSGQKFCLDIKTIKGAERITVVPTFIPLNQDPSRCNSRFLTE